MATSTTRKELPTVYDPSAVESRIYAFWEENGLFKAGGGRGKGPFSIVMPPPNVTGSLHIGHAWDNTLQDLIIRYKRMAGYDTLWLPGTDHAGIATQTRVEKALLQETGQSRHDVGRDAFIARVWDWKEQYGSTITNQIRALGASCDWSRERFTMDEGLSRAVREVFVRLYEKGLIYRGNRIINWCPRCETALSDIEVEHIEQDAKLYHVAYPTVDGDGAIVIATTRPETMFADVAVAVHPADDRYKHLVGKQVRLPLTDRTIPIIADEYVDPDFGTGCLKITPAHDPNDFEVGERHGLAKLQCINADGRLNEVAGKYQGLTRGAAREQVAADLAASGALQKVEEIHNAVGHCSRCQTVVEPFLSDQWFVHMQPLAARALEGVEAGELRFVPERFEKVFVHWLTNVRDWCISRQLWWGHRIPAWYCDDCGEITVSREDAACCAHCGSTRVHQDEDVLDTWFSSALWPFSTMGWPDQTADLARYYPTSALMTGYDILFFWVARMVFQGLEFTGKMPFRDVVLHGLIRAADGRKMSKSLNNGVDPMEVIEKYGADALRFMLATGSSPGNDQRFHWERVESARNFLNKLWNASRFVLMNLTPDAPLPAIDPAHLTLTDRWILHRLAETVDDVSRHLDRYDFGEAGRALYDFTWDDFCDWYIEFSKLSLYGEDEGAKNQTRAVLVHVLDRLLRLLHPFIPFVTEEIWQSLPTTAGALIRAEWPEDSLVFTDAAALRQVTVVKDAVRALRNLRAEMNVPPSRPIEVVARTVDAETTALFRSAEAYLKRFGNIERLEIGTGLATPEMAVTAVVTGAELLVPLAGLIDVAAERDRLHKERTKLEAEVARLDKKLGNPQFVAKAPAEVVETERAKLADYQSKLATVQERIALLEK
ncbi:valine--tRNA ligase [Alicyclobacillus cycloheptanicus]|uniref:Valine--tRNA ligase n=1 Tax=Alicyclobacillus cycloheptanicus TaxID=1457 RepID=A0ABT9XDZ4_9BACL|nr:valine--tRNA ligase [Alicyclobacillus cycloheptanicus]MDQ0188299.1 valyl-tRNA synthetase [Alicyclobacillus cycloheptanicus]WDM01015.1 valine--tRNA ligase [Alicyclobacillus cycloheptanicus]